MDSMRKHAEEFGAEIRREEVVGVELEGAVKTIQTRKGAKILSKAVIFALGADPFFEYQGEKELKEREFPIVPLTCGLLRTGCRRGGQWGSTIEEAIYLTKLPMGYHRHP